MTLENPHITFLAYPSIIFNFVDLTFTGIIKLVLLGLGIREEEMANIYALKIDNK